VGASDLTGVRRAIVGFLMAGLLIVLQAVPVIAGTPFSPSSVEKGVLLVASPSLIDPNFHEAVVLILEHGSGGTLGLIVNRSTKVLLSEALPDLALLKGTTHRLFTGGPVEPTRLLLLIRLREPPTGFRPVFDGVYVGDTLGIVERILTQAKPTETFRAFAGFARWAPGQLKYEMHQGAWAVLPPDSSGIFDKDPATLWEDCISRLTAPRLDGVAWLVPGAHGTEEGMEPDESSVLAQRAVEDSPRWTRAVEDQSAPIPGEAASERGGIMYRLVRRAQSVTNPGHPFRGEWARSESRLSPNLRSRYARGAKAALCAVVSRINLPHSTSRMGSGVRWRYLAR
jgi:putative transcriptional regulator